MLVQCLDFVWQDNKAFTLHLFEGLVCLLDSVVCAPLLFILD